MIDLTIAFFMAVVCILVHLEALNLLEKLAGKIHSFRASLLVVWVSLLAAHIIEIWLYAVAYWACERYGIGSISGVVSNLDYVYFSSVVYTTLGFGDLLPGDGVRMVAGSEGLVGLCLIAWSATITFSHVQEFKRAAELREKHMR